jgi:hypothetical protein
MQGRTSARAQARENVHHLHHHATWNERDAVRRKKWWREEDPEVPDRSAVRNALLDLDANSAAAEEEAARAEEMGSAEERSAAADAAAAAAHAHVREHAHVHCPPVDSYSVTQVRAAGGFAGAGDRVGEAQGTTRREFAGVIWIQRWMRRT